MMKVGMLGCGVVGSGVKKILDEGKTEAGSDLQLTRILVKEISEGMDARFTECADDVLDDPDIDVVVECMGGIEPAGSFVEKALAGGKSVVTSNKKMLAEKAARLYALASEHHVCLLDEAACGGGIPWMANLKRIARIEPVSSFQGIFNGTTNYILSRMEKGGADFQDVLKEAQKLGYAERDPSDDIDGVDAANKVVLSCMQAFGVYMPVSAVETFGIRHIQACDFAWAKSHGLTIRLLGTGENHNHTVSAWVMPAFVKADSLYASISANDNVLVSHSETLGTSAFAAPGAGSLPTAHAVVQDLLDLYEGSGARAAVMPAAVMDQSSVKGRYYVRTVNPAVFDDVKQEDAGDALITREISLMDLCARVQKAADEKLFAGVML